MVERILGLRYQLSTPLNMVKKMSAAAFQFGIFIYAILAMFVSSSMSMNRRENRNSSGAMVLTGWCLFAFSASTSVALVAIGVAMAVGVLPEGAFAIPLN